MKDSNLIPNLLPTDPNLWKDKGLDNACVSNCKLTSKTNMISPYLAKMHTISNRNLLNLSVLHTYLSSYATLPHLSISYKTIQLLKLMAANWPQNENDMAMFDEKYRWKLLNLVIWFICTNGSVFIDIGLIKKYKFNVFEKAMDGKSLIHFICKKNSYIDLERLVQSLEIAYLDEDITELFGDSLQGKTKAQRKKLMVDQFNVGDNQSLNTPAHVCLIYDSHECFDILMKIGVDLTISNARGWTAS